ncbi:MAG: metal-dependent hydrolase [Halobacteriales archaeon]
MPSTVVHLAVAALIAAALLEDAFGPRALAVVLAAAAIPDLDTFLGLAIPGAHRAALHTALVPLALALLVAYDTRRRGTSWLRSRGAVALAWVAVTAYALAGIGPDLFTNGANLLYPLQDRFYALSGNVLLSDQRGLVQTIWQPRPDPKGGTSSVVGTTETVHYSTGVDPTRGKAPENVERVFPVARGGLQVLLILLALVVTTARLWRVRQAR